MKRNRNKLFAVTVTAVWMAVGIAYGQSGNDALDADAAYTRAITGRADKIVATLGIGETNRAIRVRDIIVQQYRDLSAIHDVRDAKIKVAREKPGADKSTTDAVIQTAREEAQPKVDKLHGEFLARLSAELSRAQVDQVKDGLTYGVRPLTYGVYLKMYPDLTDEQKRQIMAWLVEAREIAMDGSTANEKHAVFGKYKERINNYLSRAGYDSKQGEQNLRRANSPAPEPKASKP